MKKMIAERVLTKNQCLASVCVKEELCCWNRLFQEVGGEGSDPVEDAETSATLQYEECDDLLEEQADNDGRPLDMRLMPAGEVEAELEDDQSEDERRNGRDQKKNAIPIRRRDVAHEHMNLLGDIVDDII